MGKFIVGLLVGVVAGALLVFFTFVGVPGSTQNPGTPVRPPDGNQGAGTAQITLKQDFFNQVLAIIFRDMSDPTFQLAGGEASPESVKAEQALFQGQTCDSRLTVLSEGSGVATAVNFDNGKISAPLAFTGSYNSAIGCLNFTGWALANLELRFDSSAQSVFGQLNVETVNLDGVNPILSGLITPIVQTSLNNRVNPIPIITGQQIAINAPISSASGVLKAGVQDVRAEVKDGALNLYVIYDFAGGGSAAGTPNL